MNRSVSRLACSAIVVIAGWMGAAEPGTGPASVVELRARLETFLAEPRFSGAAWGIQAVSLDTGMTLFETNALRLLKPASNNKLFTAALALDRFGPDHRIRTSFLARKPPGRTGIVRGDVHVVGRGDPSFAARFHEGDYSRSLEAAVHALLLAGVRRIEGNLVGDESFFKGPPFGSTWAWDDLQQYYGAEVSALSAEDNTLDLVFRPGPRLGAPCKIESKPAYDGVRFENLTITVTNGGARRIDVHRAPGSDVVRVTGTLPLGGKELTDAVAVRRPAMLFLKLLRAELKRRGVVVTGRLRAVDASERELHPVEAAKLVEIAHVESRPMDELVSKMMKPSQNLYAQLLFLQVGETLRGPSRTAATSEDLGVEALKSFAARLGVRESEVLLEEGSGLSRGSLVTPHAIVELLRAMDGHQHAAAFRDSLPLAGVDGTLRSRMKGTPAEGVLRGKTGTLSYVNALSGYTKTAAGERVAFAILLNNYRPPGTASGRDEVDAVAVLLTSLSGR